MSISITGNNVSANSESAELASDSAIAASTSEGNALTYRNAAQTAQTAAELAETNAETAWNTFDKIWLGNKSVEPTLDNQGAALVAGQVYYNDVEDTFKFYDGTVWNAQNIIDAVLETNVSTAAMQFVLDEDDMASNSPTKLATQQSIKAFVDRDHFFSNEGTWLDNETRTFTLDTPLKAYGKAHVTIQDETPQLGLTNNDWSIEANDTRWDTQGAPQEYFTTDLGFDFTKKTKGWSVLTAPTGTFTDADRGLFIARDGAADGTIYEVYDDLTTCYVSVASSDGNQVLPLIGTETPNPIPYTEFITGGGAVLADGSLGNPTAGYVFASSQYDLTTITNITSTAALTSSDIEWISATQAILIVGSSTAAESKVHLIESDVNGVWSSISEVSFNFAASRVWINKLDTGLYLAVAGANPSPKWQTFDVTATTITTKNSGLMYTANYGKYLAKPHVLDPSNIIVSMSDNAPSFPNSCYFEFTVPTADGNMPSGTVWSFSGDASRNSSSEGSHFLEFPSAYITAHGEGGYSFLDVGNKGNSTAVGQHKVADGGGHFIRKVSETTFIAAYHRSARLYSVSGTTVTEESVIDFTDLANSSAVLNGRLHVLVSPTLLWYWDSPKSIWHEVTISGATLTRTGKTLADSGAIEGLARQEVHLNPFAADEYIVPQLDSTGLRLANYKLYPAIANPYVGSFTAVYKREMADARLYTTVNSVTPTETLNGGALYYSMAKNVTLNGTELDRADFIGMGTTHQPAAPIVTNFPVPTSLGAANLPMYTPPDNFELSVEISPGRWVLATNRTLPVDTLDITVVDFPSEWDLTSHTITQYDLATPLSLSALACSNRQGVHKLGENLVMYSTGAGGAANGFVHTVVSFDASGVPTILDQVLTEETSVIKLKRTHTVNLGGGYGATVYDSSDLNMRYIVWYWDGVSLTVNKQVGSYASIGTLDDTWWGDTNKKDMFLAKRVEHDPNGELIYIQTHYKAALLKLNKTTLTFSKVYNLHETTKGYSDFAVYLESDELVKISANTGPENTSYAKIDKHIWDMSNGWNVANTPSVIEYSVTRISDRTAWDWSKLYHLGGGIYFQKHSNPLGWNWTVGYSGHMIDAVLTDNTAPAVNLANYSKAYCTGGFIVKFDPSDPGKGVHQWSIDVAANEIFHEVGAVLTSVSATALSTKLIASNRTTVTGGTDGDWYYCDSDTSNNNWVLSPLNTVEDALAKANVRTSNRTTLAKLNGATYKASLGIPEYFSIAVYAEGGATVSDIVLNYDAQIHSSISTHEYDVNFTYLDTVEITAPATGVSRNARVYITR